MMYICSSGECVAIGYKVHCIRIMYTTVCLTLHMHVNHMRILHFTHLEEAEEAVNVGTAHTRRYAHTDAQTCTITHAHTYMLICIHRCTNIQTCTFTHTHMHTPTHTHMHVHA